MNKLIAADSDPLMRAAIAQARKNNMKASIGRSEQTPGPSTVSSTFRSTLNFLKPLMPILTAPQIISESVSVFKTTHPKSIPTKQIANLHKGDNALPSLDQSIQPTTEFSVGPVTDELVSAPVAEIISGQKLGGARLPDGFD